MRFRRLGRTELMVSEIALGTVELGLDYGIRTGTESNQPSELEAGHLLNTALDLGINFIDTAAAYGTSETVIGRALRGRRADFFIATKCLHYCDTETDASEVNRRIERSIDESLDRLQTDVIDLIQIHGRDVVGVELQMIREGQVFGALEKARREGKIRFIGYSSYWPEVSLAIVDDGRWDTLQFAYNIMDQRHGDVIETASNHDLGLVVRSALLKGALTNKSGYLPDHLQPLVQKTRQLEGLLNDEIPTLPQLALRFVLSNPAITSIVVGADRIPYVEEAVSVSDGAGLPVEVFEGAKAAAINDLTLINPSKWGIP